MTAPEADCQSICPGKFVSIHGFRKMVCIDAKLMGVPFAKNLIIALMDGLRITVFYAVGIFPVPAFKHLAHLAHTLFQS